MTHTRQKYPVFSEQTNWTIKQRDFSLIRRVPGAKATRSHPPTRVQQKLRRVLCDISHFSQTSSEFHWRSIMTGPVPTRPLVTATDCFLLCRPLSGVWQRAPGQHLTINQRPQPTPHCTPVSSPALHTNNNSGGHKWHLRITAGVLPGDLAGEGSTGRWTETPVVGFT